MNRSLWEEAYRKVRRGESKRQRRIVMFGLKRDAAILDLGCGDGLNLKIFRRLGYTRVYGLDRSYELLSFARDSSRLVAGDATRLGLADRSFDVIFVDSFFHHLMDVAPAVREIGRILVPGGILCFMEPRDTWLRRLVDGVTLSPAGCWGPLRQRRITLKEEFPLYQHWRGMQKTLPELLSGASFEIIFWRRTLLGMFVKCRKVS